MNNVNFYKNSIGFKKFIEMLQFNNKFYLNSELFKGAGMYFTFTDKVSNKKYLLMGCSEEHDIDIFGGARDPGEHILACAIRECFEELFAMSLDLETIYNMCYLTVSMDIQKNIHAKVKRTGLGVGFFSDIWLLTVYILYLQALNLDYSPVFPRRLGDYIMKNELNIPLMIRERINPNLNPYLIKNLDYHLTEFNYIFALPIENIKKYVKTGSYPKFGDFRPSLANYILKDKIF